jgi:hypothetical protein
LFVYLIFVELLAINVLVFLDQGVVYNIMW